MDNYSATGHEEKLPQHHLEAFDKLVNAGASHEMISSFLGLKLEVVQQILVRNPSQMARMTNSIREKSKEYRCGLSNRLMTSPVMTADGNYYEQSCLKEHPSISSEHVMFNPKLKTKISEFCRESLEGLVGHLRQKELPEDILELSAECLSVLSIETEVETVLKVLGAVGGETMGKLIDRLRHLVAEEDLITLMHRSTKQLPALALHLAKHFMLNPLSERAFEKAFMCFTELLSQIALSTGAIDMAEQVSEKLNSTQLGQMNQALQTQPREEEVELRLERLRLKEAYMRLREGDTETAVRLVSILQNTPHLEREVLEFYEMAGMNCGKISVFKHKLSTALQLISGESQLLAATLDTFQQLFYAELQALSMEAATQKALNSLRGEVGTLCKDQAQVANLCKSSQSSQEAMLQGFQEKSQQAEAATQQTLISLKRDIEVLRKEHAQVASLCKRTQSNQEAMSQRFQEKSQQAETATQNCLTRFRADLRAVHEQILKSGEEAKRVQNFIESSQKADCATEKGLSILRDRVEALIEDRLKEGEEIKQVTRAHDILFHNIDEKFNKAEAATQQTLISLKRDLEALRKEQAQVASLCNSAQSSQKAMLQRFQDKSQQAEAATHETHISLKRYVEDLWENQGLNVCKRCGSFVTIESSQCDSCKLDIRCGRCSRYKGTESECKRCRNCRIF
jgi:hypothetical protein